MTRNSKSVCISYQPLQTMDRLHVLLLQAISQEQRELQAIATALALPTSVIEKEFRLLESYGYLIVAEGISRLSDRGVQLAAVADQLGWEGSVEFEASPNTWRVGPGEFFSPPWARNMDSVEMRAKQLGVLTTKASSSFLRERHRSEAVLAKFLRQCNESQSEAISDPVRQAEEIVSHLKHAESKAAVTNLDELLEAEMTSLRTPPVVAELSDKIEQLEKEYKSQRILKRFENQRLGEVRNVCETILISTWLREKRKELAEAFDIDPTLFRFSSGIAFPSPEGRKLAPSPKKERKSPKQSVGLIRAFFRWITG